MDNVQAAEQERADDGQIRSPKGEDYEGNRQPAAVTEAVTRPNAACVVHDVVQTAESGNHTAETGGNVFVTVYIDAGGIGRCRIFTDRAERQAGTRLHQNAGRNQCNDDGSIGQKTVGENGLAQLVEDFRTLVFCRKSGNRIHKRKMLCKGTACLRECNGWYIGMADLDQRAAEEVADADTERGKGKTGNVLICPHRYCQEAVQKSHQAREEQRAKQRDQDGEDTDVPMTEIGTGLFKEEAADNAADGAHIHDAGDTEVQVAGFLGDDFTGRTVQKRNALHDGSSNEGKYNHDSASSSAASGLFSGSSSESLSDPGVSARSEGVTFATASFAFSFLRNRME